MSKGRNRPRRHRRVQLQMMLLLVLFTLLATFLTGWVLYDRTSEQVIRDAWQQHEALLRNACSAVNREIEQLRSFSWQMNNDSGVQMYLHLAEQTPRTILTKKEIIEKLQQMKAFSGTLSDLGIYAEGLDIVITGESSYHAEDYYSRISGVTREQVEARRAQPGAVALCAYVGRGSMHRILSSDPILTFVSSLPLNTQAGESYAVFHLNADLLKACLPESDSGALLLTDAAGEPALEDASDSYGDVSRSYMAEPRSLVNDRRQEYGVLSMETDADGLYCMAIVPYDDLLRSSRRLRATVMTVMGVCMLLGLAAAVLVSRRMFSPLERIIGEVRQLCRGLPEETRGNEYQVLEDAIRTITAENHELTLSNLEVNRLLKNRLLSDWMEGRLRGGAEDPLARVGVILPYGRTQVAVAETAPQDLARLEARLGGENVADRMEALAASQDLGPVRTWCARRTDGRILILFNLDAQHPNPERIYQYLQTCREQLFRDCPCAIGVGRAYEKDRVSNSLVDAMFALRGGAEGGRSLSFAEEVRETSETEYTLTAEQQLINRILSGKKEEAEHLVRTLCAPEEGMAVPGNDLIRALLFTAERTARHAGLEDQLEETLAQHGFLPDRMPAGADTVDRLCRVFSDLADRINSSVSSQEEKLYARLTDYIRREYMHDISLDSVSEALSMSPSYVSMVFRQVGGTSFLKYLTTVRMDEVKRLLVSTDLTLREIGLRVGIENQNTLIRTFKKAEGVTPGQYRLSDQSIHSQNG